MINDYHALDLVRELRQNLSDLELEIETLRCEEEHCEDEHGDLIDPDPARRYVYAKLNRIKLGLYRADHDGDLLTVLEEIERLLR